MKLKIYEDKYGNPTLEYKSNEYYLKYREVYSRQKASKLHYNSLNYSINELVNDISKILNDYGDYNVDFVIFDGILLENNDENINQRVHVGLNEQYDNLNELYEHLVITKNLMNDTRIDHFCIRLKKIL